MQVAENHHSDWKRSLAGPLVLLAIVIVFNWKLVLTDRYTWLESPDIVNQVLPWFQFQAAEWHAGHFPMWDPNDWAGQTLFGQLQPGSAYPLNWLLFLLPLKLGWMQLVGLHWYLVVIRYMGALAAYALCRDLGRSQLASIVGGCVFGLGGFVGHTGWPQWLNGVVWAPLVLMYLLRVERGDRTRASAALAGLFLGVAWLAGHHQVPLLLSLTAVGTWLWLTLRHGRVEYKMARLAILSLTIAVLTSGLQTIPAAEHGPRSVRWSEADHPLPFNEPVPYSVHQKYAMRPLNIVSIALPSFDTYVDPHIGITALALGLFGIAAAWKEKTVRYLAMVALAALIFGLGGKSVIHGFLYSFVPMVEKARVPGAALAIFAAASAPLIAFGVDLAAGARQTSWALAAVGAVILGTGIYLGDERMTGAALCALVLAVLLWAWRTERVPAVAARLAICAIIWFELSNVTNYYLPEVRVPGQIPNLSRMSTHSDLIDALRQEGSPPPRIEYDGEAIPYNIGDWYGISAFDAYTSSMAADMARQDLYAPSFRDFFGIRYAFLKTPRRPEQREIFHGKTGVNVYENPRALPRTWAVHESVAADPKQARTLLANSVFDPRKQVFFLNRTGPSLERCDTAGERVELQRDASSGVTIAATLNCRAMVILTDTWAPGWKATVDGRPAVIEPAYGIVRGIVVDRGDHIIDMRYRPWSVMLGAALTLLGVVLCVLVQYVRLRDGARNS